ncbi:MAG: GNAT family N-acetyltransferase [Henriciella sp.]
MVTIKQAQPEDAGGLAAIGAATFLEAFCDHIAAADLLLHLQRQHDAETYRAYLTAPDPRNAAWLALHETTRAPVGYALTCPPDLPIPTEESDLELKRLYLFSKYHGSGVASALERAAETHARRLGARNMLLGTHEDNDRAAGFYRKCGYRMIGRRPFQIGDAIMDDIIMSRAL